MKREPRRFSRTRLKIFRSIIRSSPQLALESTKVRSDTPRGVCQGNQPALVQASSAVNMALRKAAFTVLPGSHYGHWPLNCSLQASRAVGFSVEQRPLTGKRMKVAVSSRVRDGRERA
jgi:hypothetical protein